MKRSITTPPSSRAVALAAVALAAVFVAVLPAAAQADGRIVGAVLNGLTGQAVPGARVVVVETGTATTTDPDGLYRLTVAAGSYSLRVTKADFAEQRVVDVGVAGGRSVDLSVVLMPAAGGAAEQESAAFAEEITVAAEADTSTEAAMLAERRHAGQISDLIGSQEMAKTTGGDAAGVLKRVTGISLQDDKYVYVRGLGDRYSNTLLNGAKIPSTEFERKVVPLDLFPTDLLDKVRVSKSYSVDRPGDFAAGFVELETLQFPSTRTLAVGLSAGQDSAATGEPYLAYGSGLDFFGAGGQPLPASIPDADLLRFSPFTGLGFTTAELEGFGEQLVGLWQPSQGRSAPLNRGYKLSYGDTIGRLGLVFSASYGNDFGVRREATNIFSVTAAGGVVPESTYDVDYGEEQVRQSLLANLAYRLSPDHNLRLRSIYSTLAVAEGRELAGHYGDFATDIRDSRVSQQEQEVVNLQLSGDHYLGGVGAGGSLLEWQASASTAATDENRRQAIYRLVGGEYRLTPDAQSGFMYFNELSDDLVDSTVNWTTFLTAGRLNGALKGGLAYSTRDRDFDGRRLRFLHRGTFGIDLTLPPDQVFVPENIRPNGFEIEEITRPTDTYAGTHDVGAAYAQADLGRGRWRLIGGLRFEDSQIELLTLDRTDPSLAMVATELAETDLLPAFSVVYQMTPQMNLRGAFSQTVNRPEFRELAPFNFTHVLGGYAVTGNPDLESADISSYDLRWEWFPSASEVVAVSLFYKDFDNPIEAVVVGAAELRETFENAESARNYGFELEARRELGGLMPSLAPFSVVLNGTWVDSQIEIDPQTTILTNPTRALAGQPEVVGNAVLEWNRPGGLSVLGDSNVRLLWNYVGEKVAAGGALRLPDVIEEARSTIDLVWSPGLGALVPGLDLKLSATNITEEEYLWTQGDGELRRYQPGRKIGLSLGYRLY